LLQLSEIILKVKLQMIGTNHALQNIQSRIINIKNEFFFSEGVSKFNTRSTCCPGCCCYTGRVKVFPAFENTPPIFMSPVFSGSSG